MKIALFPGSFDPFTLGHVDILERACPLFDKIVVGIGYNSSKKYLFDIEDRKRWIAEIFVDNPKVEIQTFDGLTVEFCKKIGANYIVRGLRNTSDFDFEKNIAQLNKAMTPEIETIFILSEPSLSHISSTIVREILKYKGDAKDFLPQEVLKDL